MNQYDVVESNFKMFGEFKAENPLPSGCTCRHTMVNPLTSNQDNQGNYYGVARMEIERNLSCPIHGI